MIWSKYNLLLDVDDGSYALFNTSSRTLLTFDKETYDEFLYLKENPDSYTEFEDADFLTKNMIIVDSDVDIFSYHLNEILRRRYNPNVMSLTIAVTRACLFNCIYCYETDRPPVYLNETTENHIIDFIKTNSSLQELAVVWYGGEPLMNFQSIERLTEKFKKLGIKYGAEIITNGYLLTKEISDQFSDLAIRKAQITLDGLKEVHDKRRPLCSGKGTFDVIVSNIEYLLSVCPDIEINLRSNMDMENVGGYVEFYKYITNRLNNDRVKPYMGYVQDILNSGCTVESNNIGGFNNRLPIVQEQKKRV